jgi:hypothetical protein
MDVDLSIRYGIGFPSLTLLTQPVVTYDTDDTIFGKLFRRQYVWETFRNKRHHVSPVTSLVLLVYLLKIGGCVLPIISILVQHQRKGDKGDRGI